MPNNVSYLMGDNLESFYWIGFLMADGCFRNSNFSVNGNKNPDQITIFLSSLDSDHLKKLSVNLSKQLKVVKNYGGFSKNESKISLTVNNNIVVPQICEKFGINLRKTYNPPLMSTYDNKFTKDQILSIIIGMIDGDGSITSNGNSGYDLKIELHKSWNDNLIYINNFMHNYFEIMVETKIRKTKHGGSSLSIGKQNILSFLKHFINENGLPAMERKWNVIIPKDPKNTEPTKAYRKNIIVNGIEFKSQYAAAKHFNISPRQIGRLARKYNGTVNLF